jgi:hypothetical protein
MIRKHYLTQVVTFVYFVIANAILGRVEPVFKKTASFVPKNA